ncbi:LURP-one-related family protein [Corynebacterium sp. c8Ua_181]|uniref:LURP-one-related family protein n=1 Tax=Corynebacterium curieae TaxID=2913500 RepID=A0A9X3MDT4_9CORY|nr:LURP-one-related family protein [Corynebacterium curieae]MCZ9307468.1 LURP-one-related family protein [Corynebacterium curieae]MDV2424308.1 LURP-one-related family protein [Corynebacterium curieae]
MSQNLFTLDELVISQTKSFLNDQFMIADINGTPVGTILQSTSLKDMVFKSSRSLEVALTDAEGTPLQTVMTISDPPNFLRDTYEVHLPGIEQPMAVITKRFSLLKTKLDLTMEGFADVEIHGDFWDWNLSITSGDRLLADVSNEWTGMGNFFMGKNTYRLRITPGLNEQQHAAIIGAVMSMDMLRTKQNNSD